MSSFLSTLETAAVKTFDLIFKMIEESTKAVGLALEGHSLIIHPQTVFARGGGGGYTVWMLSFRPSFRPQHIKSLNEIHET